MNIAVQRKQVAVGKASPCNRGLHVCFVSSFPPNQARLSEYGYHLVNELQKRSEISRVDVIADCGRSSGYSKVSDRLVVNYFWKPNNVLSVLLIFFKLLELRPDVVHFNLHMAVFGRSRIVNSVGLFLPFLCRLVGFRTIVTLHNLVDRVDVKKAGFKKTVLNRIGSFAALKFLTFSSVLTVLVRSYVDLIKKRYGAKKVLWIPHGTWQVKRAVHHSSNPAMILYMGHSGPSKDLDLLLDAFDMLRQNRDIELVIAGRSHPNYPGFLERYKEKMSNVEFTGYVPEDQLPALFGKAQVLVLPYHTCTGTSGMAHLAASYGVPVVATDLPELRELVEEGCGIVLCTHDVRSLVEKICYVLDNVEVATNLRRCNLDFAKSRTWDRIADSFFVCY